ncbi:MAG: UDP-N-acetylmuramate:L-alanyl-gamma-D-glutamyl-meso-diaminopimelate ligase [Pseudobdellovibrionaceae bacterium]
MLKAGAHIHLMGICGTAMASLAGLLKDQGFKITGSDANPYPPMSTQIEQLGIQIQKGYQAENLNPKPDFVIVGNVISANNPEAQEVLRLNIPFTSLPKAMGEYVIAHRQSLVVSGTHGKTTTTSLLAWILEVAGLKPGFLIGGIPKNFSYSFRNPSQDFFVIEGDEYDTAYFDKVPKFIHYKPRHVILTSVEFDHADIYADLDAVKKSFRQLLDLIPAHGHLVACADQVHVRELLAEKDRPYPILTYGLNEGNCRVHVLPSEQEYSRFEIHLDAQSMALLKQGQTVLGPYLINMSGDYNILNAASAVLLSLQIAVPQENIAQALKTFLGVKRRQEILGEPGGVLVIEDFAHHPTAVRETLLGIQKKYPGRKVFAVFEPRSATSRRKIFQQDYVKAFSSAPEVLLAQAFDQSKIAQADRFSIEELISDLHAQGQKARGFAQADDIVQALKQDTQSGDIVLIMSNGGFDGIYKKLLTALQV